MPPGSPATASSRSLGHRAPLLWLAAPFMTGIVFGRTGIAPPVPVLLTAAVVAVVAGSAFAHRSRFAAEMLLLLGMFLAGAASLILHLPAVGAWERLPPREARMTVRIDRIFVKADPKQFSALATVIASGERHELIDRRIYVAGRRRKDEPAPIRSAGIVLEGLVEVLPPAPPPDSFEGFLVNAGIQFRLTRARVISQTEAPTRYAKFCADTAGRFATILGTGVEKKRPALVGIYRAMLLGQQNELSDDQRQVFRESGTMHVFSISGLHIAVIAAGVQAALSLLRLPGLAQYFVGIVTLWLYVDITGAAPSAIRAFVMVALVQSAMVLRVPRNPLSAIAASALLVLLIDPLQMFSASFQMSYGIVAALLLLGLPLSDHCQQKLALFRHLPPATWGRMRRLIDWLWRGVVSASAIGLAASLVGAITGITFFNLFTPGAFVANLWLIPASSGVLFMGLISLLCGLVGFTAGTVLANHAGVLLLWGIESGVRAVAGMPAVWFEGTYRQPWFGSLAFVLLLASLAAGYARNWTGWHRYFWAPFALVALTLFFGVQFR